MEGEFHEFPSLDGFCRGHPSDRSSLKLDVRAWTVEKSSKLETVKVIDIYVVIGGSAECVITQGERKRGLKKPFIKDRGR